VTVRDMVKAAQVEIRDTEDMSAHRAAELLNHLSALIGNINDVIRKADAEYAIVRAMCIERSGKVNLGEAQAEITPEYQRKREARDTKELAQGLISALKYTIKSEHEAMRLAR
jgi:hypothetical protein